MGLLSIWRSISISEAKIILKMIHLVFWNLQTGVLPLHLKLSPVWLRIWCQPYLATNRNVCLASCFPMPKIQHSEMNKNRSQKTQNVQTGIMLVPCLVWRHARACGKFLCGIFLPFLSKMCQPTDFCVQTHFVLLVLDFELCCTSLPLLHTSKASKRIMYIFSLPIFLSMHFWNYQHFLMQKSMPPDDVFQFWKITIAQKDIRED